MRKQPAKLTAQARSRVSKEQRRCPRKMSFSNLLMKNAASAQLRVTAGLLNQTTRHGHTIRGKPPGVARTLEQRLQEENVVDPELSARINIGFPKLRGSRSEELQQRLAHLKAQRSNNQLEQQSRNNNLLIDLDKVEEEYVKTGGQHDLRLIADHYGVFKDLFGCAYFVPRVPLNIAYEVAADSYNPVYNGNIIKPAEAAKAPQVSFDGETDPITSTKLTSGTAYWTLLATNPDAHFTAGNAECVHWFIANIPNGDVSAGEVLVDYLPPFPPKGLGYQRFVFVLYKQHSKLDLSAYKLAATDYNKLEKRQFSTLDFYRQQQDVLTPAGLAFYQSNWDQSLTKFFHEVLNTKEPIYEYDFPKPYLSDQKLFPLRQPFNLYMDKHRDEKQVNKEFLQRKLAKTHPFEGPEPPKRYPNAHPIRGVSSWLKTEMRKARLRIGRVQDY